MYIYDPRKSDSNYLGEAQPIILRPSQRIVIEHPLVGQPPSSIPPCIAMPSWITVSKHFFSPKTRASSTGGKLEWKSSSTHEELRPDKLNPGYFFTATQGLARDAKLHKELQTLMADLQANKSPFDKEPFKTFVRRRGQIKVALVDLSNDNRLVLPEIAEFNSTHVVHGGSLAKLGLLYAAFQNRFDLNVLGRTNPASLTPNLTKLRTIYDDTQTPGSPVVTFAFNSGFQDALDGICNNCKASRISRNLGLSYVNSALWQSGLYHCRWGGIWVGAHYNEWDNRINKWECDKDPYFYKGVCTREGCHTDPKGRFNLAVNALSVATFFTLLEQGRLIDDPSSQSIKDILIKQPDTCGSRFKKGLTDAARFTATDRIYSKIGVTKSVSHEGALIDRASIGKKYVAVVLTVPQGGDGGLVREKLIQQLDILIETNS